MRSTKRILIVDDSPAIRSSLRNLIELQEDWRVCGEAENGREGIDKAQELKPDLILLDLSMPVMNGFEAAREIQRLMPNVPLMMFTMFSSPELERQALSVGIRHIGTKSAGAGVLVHDLHELLDAA